MSRVTSSALEAVSGAAIGFVSSFVNPFFLYPQTKEVNNILDNKIESVHSLVNRGIGVLGYFMGIGVIAANILEEPRNPSRYLPILSNILIGSAIKYNEHKKNALQEHHRKIVWFEM